MRAIRTTFRRLRSDKRGATAIEYGLIAALIAVAIVGALTSMGGGAGGMWTVLDDRITSATQGTPPADAD